ncbi:MAG TPA: hypothetical protein DER09_01010 [Prolixibacteraceae bacterium]|nr:hypothetical protein [Prolixibacteraceae bacterium]
MMQYISKITVVTILLNLLFFQDRVLATNDQENPLTKAIQLFDKRKFTEAETAFKKLIDERPEDFMINYFYGACRTENGFYSDADLGYLEKASKEVYPIDIDYYFGVQYHAKNLFNKALIHYKNFRKVASVEEQIRVELSVKIELCEQRRNPFVTESVAVTIVDSAAVNVAIENTTEELTAETISETSVLAKTTNDTTSENTEVALPTELSGQTDASDSIVTENIEPVAETAEKQPVPAIQKPTGPVINFNINSEITYLYESHFKTSEGANYFKEGNEKQAEMEKIMIRTEILREHYAKSKSKAEKDSLGQLIVGLENDTYQLKTLVKQLLVQAKTTENSYWQNAPVEEKEKFLSELDALAKEITKENTAGKETPVTGILLSPLLVEDAPIEKPVKEVKSAGINYKIQIGAYSKGIPNPMKPVFKKISMLRKVENYIDDKGVVVYTTGNLNNYDDAVLMLNQVKQEGVKDAIIAAYQNGKRITLEQAKETEKQK